MPKGNRRRNVFVALDGSNELDSGVDHQDRELLGLVKAIPAQFRVGTRRAVIRQLRADRDRAGSWTDSDEEDDAEPDADHMAPPSQTLMSHIPHTVQSDWQLREDECLRVQLDGLEFRLDLLAQVIASAADAQLDDDALAEAFDQLEQAKTMTAVLDRHIHTGHARAADLRDRLAVADDLVMGLVA